MGSIRALVFAQPMLSLAAGHLDEGKQGMHIRLISGPALKGAWEHSSGDWVEVRQHSNDL